MNDADLASCLEEAAAEIDAENELRLARLQALREARRRRNAAGSAGSGVWSEVLEVLPTREMRLAWARVIAADEQAQRGYRPIPSHLLPEILAGAFVFLSPILLPLLSVPAI